MKIFYCALALLLSFNCAQNIVADSSSNCDYENTCDYEESCDSTYHRAEEELWHAINDGNIERVKELIAAGVCVNAINEIGNTALVLAVKAGHLDLVRLLIENGAQDFNGNALRIAQYKLKESRCGVQFIPEWDESTKQQHLIRASQQYSKRIARYQEIITLLEAVQQQ